MPQETNNNTVTQVGFYNVPQRPIIKKNLEMYSKAMDNLYEQHREAIKQRSAIDIALSQIELDDSENEWKYNYAQRIRDQIDSKAKYGDYSGALDTATMLASSAVSSPELLGRQKAHKDREEAWKQIQARNDIDEDTKRAWNLSNKYYYKDETDAQGHVIGGSKWESSWTPVSNQNVIQELAKAVSLIAPEQASNSWSTSKSEVNADGTKTAKNAEGKDTNFSSGGSNAYQRLTLPRIKKQLKDYIEGSPQLKSAILQDMRVQKILMKDAQDRLSRTTDPSEIENIQAEINMYKGNLTNSNGIITGDYMTYIGKRYPNIIQNFAYNHTQTSSSNSTSYSAYKGTDGSGGGKRKFNYLTGRWDDYEPMSVTGQPLNDPSGKEAGSNIQQAGATDKGFDKKFNN